VFSPVGHFSDFCGVTLLEFQFFRLGVYSHILGLCTHAVAAAILSTGDYKKGERKEKRKESFVVQKGSCLVFYFLQEQLLLTCTIISVNVCVQD
jgi:hypothetical protein